ncbi:hypothetical protein GH714_040219 [Hevea brasiliensis]|uniref:ABC transporter domain-containing protein n=1 Tax=Hevea brasiliensis TaxID=3981 RepID=A0A6A6MPW5_HEVBR|nr:hypothetical protein GH714_040219 [Hevea brasiliensis]
MASATGVLLQINPTRFPIPKLHVRPINKHKLRQSQLSISSAFCHFPPFSQSYVKRWSTKISTISCAYVSGPPTLSEPDPKVDASESTTEEVQSTKLISWGLLWSLLLKHKLRLGVSVLALVGCTIVPFRCPYFQVEFFDRYKIGELSALLTFDLGSLKDIVNENISRDRGFRALSEASHSILEITILKPHTSGQLYCFQSSWNGPSIQSDCVTETFSAIRTGELSVGTVASFIGYTFTLTFAVQGLVNTFGDLRGTFAAVERINSVLSEVEIDEALANGLEREIQEKENHDEITKLFFVNGYSGKNRYLNAHYMSALKSASNLSTYAWSGDVCLEDVHFSYPLRPDVEILNGLNLKLKCGTVTALVGPSGAGKSTIVQLLARFYEPTRGKITVAGEDVRTFDKTEWARVVSIVNQEPVLFSVSVGENIAYGLPDDNVSKDDIIKAAKAANAHEFIISLPQGYDTLVGERGGLLSGGQRQRVAIARALLKNAPILILDEATSALDAVSERLVQDALNHLMKGRTTLVIAHRLSTVQNAHQIALCSGGRVAELGTHFELLAKKGQYASLVGTQRLAFE